MRDFKRTRWRFRPFRVFWSSVPGPVITMKRTISLLAFAGAASATGCADEGAVETDSMASTDGATGVESSLQSTIAPSADGAPSDVRRAQQPSARDAAAGSINPNNEDVATRYDASATLDAARSFDAATTVADVFTEQAASADASRVCRTVTQPCGAGGSCCADGTCVDGMCALRCTVNTDCPSLCCISWNSTRAYSCAPAVACLAPTIADAGGIGREGSTGKADYISCTENAECANRCCVELSPTNHICAPAEYQLLCPGAVKEASTSPTDGGDATKAADYAACTRNEQCQNDCCVTLSAGNSVCAPMTYADLCRDAGGIIRFDASLPTGGGDPSLSGTVLVAYRDWFAISTVWGTQVFQAQTSCFNVLAGAHVRFEDSTGACVANTFTNPSTGASCDVWCQASRYRGTAVSADTSILITSSYGQQSFSSGTGCYQVRPGDEVYLTKSPLSCVSNILLDTTRAVGCNLDCD